MFLYTKQFDWEKMWAIADDVTDEAAIRAKAGEILDTFEIEGGGTVDTVWEMARYVVAFEAWVKEEKLASWPATTTALPRARRACWTVCSSPAFSMLIKQGVACAVEGDIKVAMPCPSSRPLRAPARLSEMYSIDFDKDICIIGHSGSGDAAISAKKPTMKIVPVFHGKTAAAT